MILNPNWKLRKLNRNTPWTQHFAMAWDSFEFFSKQTWEKTVSQGWKFPEYWKYYFYLDANQLPRVIDLYERIDDFGGGQ